MSQRFPGVTFVHATDGRNKKLGFADQVYASIEATCPSDCALRGNGCYAQHGTVSFTTRRLDREATGMTPFRIARHQAMAIDASYRGGRVPRTDLRLNVSGDMSSPRGARTIAAAVARWQDRGGRSAWGYTHAWRSVLRQSWGPVSTLASLDNIADAPRAMRRGYAVARVVESFPNGDRAWSEAGILWVPCPEQTKGIQCFRCRLCHDADKLRRLGTGIAFLAHGQQKKRVLQVLQ